MIQQRILSTLIAVVMMCFLSMHIAAQDACASAKAEELRRKIADIGLLKQQLSDRQRQVETVLEELMVQQRDLAAEVHLLQKSFGFSSYEQARRIDRAYYNIELLRTITAYINTFSEKIRIYKAGCDKLAYLHQLANDDIKMINTLSDFQIDALTTQISLVINRYLAEAHIVQIDPEKITPLPAAIVWEAIEKGNL